MSVTKKILRALLTAAFARLTFAVPVLATTIRVALTFSMGKKVVCFLFGEMTMKFDFPANLIGVFCLLRSTGKDAFLVGGCVRDSLLGLKPKDFDIVTEVDLDLVSSVFKEDGWTCAKEGLNFKVLHVSRDGHRYEIAQFRTDSHPEPNKTIVSAGDIFTDAARRDFTVNALYLEPWTGEVIDPTGQGLSDIENKRIRFVGDPRERINEDFIRSLRFFRFILKYKDFSFDKQTYLAARRGLQLLKESDCPVERIFNEIERMCGIQELLSNIDSTEYNKIEFLRYQRGLEKSKPESLIEFLFECRKLGVAPNKSDLSYVRAQMWRFREMSMLKVSKIFLENP